jgi:hypothetical protein
VFEYRMRTQMHLLLNADWHGSQKHLEIDDSEAALSEFFVRHGAPKEEGKSGIELGEAAVEVLRDASHRTLVLRE